MTLTLDEPKKTRRGTTNKNHSGNAQDRRRRKIWLLETYRANVDFWFITIDGVTVSKAFGQGQPACRCYCCGTLLTIDMLTVDRIIPGALGGSYRKENIRPACSKCNSVTGGSVRSKRQNGSGAQR